MELIYRTDIEQRKYSLCGQIKYVFCYIGKGSPLSNYSLLKFTVPCFMALYVGGWVIQQSVLFVHATWRKGLQRVLGIPYCTQSRQLPIMSSYLPSLDELCRRTATFIKGCLELNSPIVYCCLLWCLLWLYELSFCALFCCSQFYVTVILSITRHGFSLQRLAYFYTS